MYPFVTCVLTFYLVPFCCRVLRGHVPLCGGPGDGPDLQRGRHDYGDGSERRMVDRGSGRQDRNLPCQLRQEGGDAGRHGCPPFMHALLTGSLVLSVGNGMLGKAIGAFVGVFELFDDMWQVIFFTFYPVFFCLLFPPAPPTPHPQPQSIICNHFITN